MAVVSEKQREIAKALGGDAGPLTLQSWVANNAPREDAVVDRVENEIAKLQVRAGPEVVEAFIARADALRRQASPERRQSMADSLLLELVAAI